MFEATAKSKFLIGALGPAMLLPIWDVLLALSTGTNEGRGFAVMHMLLLTLVVFPLVLLLNYYLVCSRSWEAKSKLLPLA